MRTIPINREELSPNALCRKLRQFLELMIDRISRRRLDLLTLAYRQAGFERRAAGHRARLAYTAYTGFLQLNQRHGMPRMDHDDYEAYVTHVIETLIPG